MRRAEIKLAVPEWTVLITVVRLNQNCLQLRLQSQAGVVKVLIAYFETTELTIVSAVVLCEDS